ncbi:MAG: hypothetical protein WD266_08020 [Balneolales bacterium]
MLNFSRTTLAIALILFFWQGPAGGQTSNPDGDLKISEPEDIWVQTFEGSHYNEIWSYHFYLNDGMKVHITFSVANFGSFKSPVSGVRVSVYNLDDELHQVSREYPIDVLVQDKDNFIFRPKPDREVYFKGKLPEEHEVRVKTSKDGNNYDISLSLENIAEGYKWEQGQFMVGNEKIGIITHIPYAEVKGHVSVNNNTEKVTGTAYMDHTFQNQTTTRLLHSGYRFVYHEDAENWDLLYFLYPSSRDSRAIGYRLVNRDNNIRLYGAKDIKEMTRSRAFGNTIAQDIELELENSNTIRLSRSKDEERFSVLGELGWIQRRAARAFLGGEVLDFRGEAVLTEPGSTPKTGHYNFFQVD